MKNYEKPSLQTVRLTADIICTSAVLLTNAGSTSFDNAEKIVFA